MANVYWEETVSDPMRDAVSSALGTNAGVPWTKKEEHKAVKLSAGHIYVACVDDDPIEGFVEAVDPTTVNGGYGFGTVRRGGSKKVQLATGVSGAAVKDVVVAAAQIAFGTDGIAQVKPEATPGDAGFFPWRIVRLYTDGNAGSYALISRI